MAEKVLMMSEMEAGEIYSLVVNALQNRKWDLHDEVSWNEAVCLKSLEEKLRQYLDYGVGRDVREVGGTT